MANKYSSILRTFRGRRLHESAISPPNNFTIANTAWNPVVINRSFNIVDSVGGANTLSSQFNLNGNFKLNRVGLFCNFADGLINGTTSPGLNLSVRAGSAIRSQIAATTITGGPASDVLTVAGPGTGLVAGEPILLMGGSTAFNSPLWEYAFVKTWAAPNLTLYDYPKWTYTGADVYLLTAQSVSNWFFNIDMNEFNYMYEVDHFFAPLQFAVTGATDMFLFAQVLNNGTMTYLTKSIDTTYVGDPCIIDVVADVEYTIPTDTQYSP